MAGCGEKKLALLTWLLLILGELELFTNLKCLINWALSLTVYKYTKCGNFIIAFLNVLVLLVFLAPKLIICRV